MEIIKKLHCTLLLPKPMRTAINNISEFRYGNFFKAMILSYHNQCSATQIRRLLLFLPSFLRL